MKIVARLFKVQTTPRPFLTPYQFFIVLWYNEGGSFKKFFRNLIYNGFLKEGSYLKVNRDHDLQRIDQ